MTPEQAELDIQQAAKQVSLTRHDNSLTEDERSEKLVVLEAEIVELKKITGQRRIFGEIHIGGHSQR